MKYRHTYIYKTLCLTLAICATLFSPAALTLDTPAQNSSLQSSSSSSTLSDLADALGEPEEEFLHVDEAYQLAIRDNGSELIAEWVIAEKYYLYGEKFNVSANGETIETTREPGKVSYDTIFEKDVEKYYHFAKVVISKDQLPKNQSFNLQVGYQGCADAGLCYPPEKKVFSISANFSDITSGSADNTTGNGGALNSTSSSTSPQASSWLITLSMILLAIAGGSILNLMPCVFPVLSFKALSLVENQDHQSRIRHGWSYTLGCLVTFVAVAAALLIARNAGEAVGWGFQLQNPTVVTCLAFLFFIMGLSLSGFVTFGTSWMNTGQNLTQGHGMSQSFFTGVLAAVVASPCTGPFMASALGYALTQPPIISLLIFAALGFGMALPFLLLSYLPKLGRYLPQPGAWMETFKEAIAFPLYLTCVWLLWVLGHQIGGDGVILAILGAVGIVFVFWLEKRKTSLKPFGLISSLLIVGLMMWNVSQTEHTRSSAANSEDSVWENYTPTTLASLRAEGKPVFVNLTADWCITCKVNEKVVFTDSTLAKMKDKGIHLVKGDWTNYDAEITALLEKYGRGGVPLYLVFPAGPSSEAKVLPQLLRPGTFNTLIDNI